MEGFLRRDDFPAKLREAKKDRNHNGFVCKTLDFHSSWNQNKCK